MSRLKLTYWQRRRLRRQLAETLDARLFRWTSVMMTASFSGALNSIGIAILGEYIIRIYDQVRARPHYVVERRTNFDEQIDQSAGLTDSRRAA